MSFTGFLNPFGLLGLLSLPVVLALHLLRERSQRYNISSLHLWSFLETEVRGSQPRRIPITWLLVVDLLIATLLSLALSQPNIQITGAIREGRHEVILLDVSNSMQAKDVLPSRFARAQLELVSLLTDLGPQDVATLVTFGAASKWIGDTREMDVQELIVRVNSLQPGEVGHSLESALVLALASIEGNIPVRVHIITDGAYPEFDLSSLNHPVQWHLVGGTNVSNQAVVRVSASPLGASSFQVFARLGNFGEKSVRRVVTLLADGVPLDSTTLTMPPDSIISEVWTVTGRPTEVSVMLVGADFLPQDDVATIGIHLENVLKVTLVAENPYPLDRALGSIPGVDLRVLSPDEYIFGVSSDVLVFKGFLPSKWPSGFLVVFEPPLDSVLLDIQGLEKITSLPIPESDIFVDSVDFSGVRWSQAWALETLPEGFTPLLQADGLPIITLGRQGLSRIYLLLMDLDSGNLTRHPAFPILLANILKNANYISLPKNIKSGEKIALPLEDDFPRLMVSKPAGEVVEFTSDRPLDWSDTLEQGVYFFELIDFDGRQNRYAIGVNAGSEVESDIRTQDWISNFDGQIAGTLRTDADQTVNLMPWLLAIATLLLLMEAWLAWR